VDSFEKNICPFAKKLTIANCSEQAVSKVKYNVLFYNNIIGKRHIYLKNLIEG